jgi:hypothetical protein
MTFEMTIGLDEYYMNKLFKIHEQYGSDTALSALIEHCLQRGIDEENKAPTFNKQD